ncbi:inactive peptidyl-prolyl cis-trans isomerase FKBP6 isoform X2 [Anabrus simplex]|uniref:inactive peptidyl-prolyl cis-trans isomerase FKBP6 isoform X2 n=1 Tax=Anabrus simplex TaxID=316456 RepID=UPI0035A38416
MQEVENSYSDEDEEVGNYEDELKQTRSRLVDGINIQELLSTNVATFEVNTNVESALEEQQNNYFSSDDFLQCVNLDCLGIASDDDEEEEGAPGTAPFDRIAQKMISLVPDGKVKKRIKREGTGNVVPNDALVWIHYNSYLEYADEPFDSTFLRGRSTKIRLNQGKLIPGLEIGIKTMKKAEIAQFLIHPDYGFGKFGVPPRIPPEAEILIHVELIRYLDNATISEMDALSKEEQQNAGFPKIYKTAESLVLKGNDQFKKDNFPSAIYNYKKAVRLLEPVHMENQEQQDKQQKLLCRTYINLAVCYNKQGSHRQACSNCQDALRIQPTNSKALYNYAMASLNLGSYNQAKSLALKARKQQPHSKEINALLEKLNSKFLKYKEESETMARRAFKMPEAEKKPQEARSVARCLGMGHQYLEIPA